MSGGEGVRRHSGQSCSWVCVVGLGFIPLGLLLGGTMGPAFVAFGLTLPGLLLQDGWRSAFFAAGKGSKAFQNDLVWACTLFPGLGLLAAAGQTSIFWLTLVWGWSATIAAVIGVIQSGVRPRPLMATSWWREHRDLGPRYLTEAVVSTGASQAAWYGVGVVAGLSAVGAMRAALLMFGPLQILSTGIGLMVVPEGVRAMNRSLTELERAALALSAGLVVVAVGWCVFLLLIPESFGVWLLGSTWDAVVPLLVPLGLTFAGLLAMIGPMTVLRAVANSRRSLRANVVTSIATFAFIVAGAWLGSALGAAVGAALAAWVGTAAWWRQSLLAIRDRRRKAVTIEGVPDALPGGDAWAKMGGRSTPLDDDTGGARVPRIVAYAYSSIPGGGSEHAVGWTWTRMLAGFAEVWVITLPMDTHRADFERRLGQAPERARIHFVEVEPPAGCSGSRSCGTPIGFTGSSTSCGSSRPCGSPDVSIARTRSTWPGT